jgi:outer membrane protein assembly factor BamA
MTPSPQLFSLGARAGVLHPLTNGDDGTAPTLSDRFQLGGPTNLRMFRANNLGPRDGGAPFFFLILRLPTLLTHNGVKKKKKKTKNNMVTTSPRFFSCFAL